MNPQEKLDLDLSMLPLHSLVVLGFSGGADSVVLLHALGQQRPDLTIYAAHIQHIDPDLAPDSAAVLAFCQKICRQWNCTLHVKTGRVDRAEGRGLEAAARHQRYQFWQELCEQFAAVALILGHHADDASETVLLNIFRGSGVKGLNGLRVLTPWQGRLLIRPLLNYRRAHLRAYAAAHDLAWFEDSFNQDLRFSRNLVRQKILPNIRQHWPELDDSLVRLSHHAQEAQEILDQVAQSDWRSTQDTDSQNSDQYGQNLRIAPTLSPARQKNLLRYWLHTHHILVPSHRTLNQWVEQIRVANAAPHPDDNRHTRWVLGDWVLGEYVFYYWRQRVWLTRSDTTPHPSKHQQTTHATHAIQAADDFFEPPMFSATMFDATAGLLSDDSVEVIAPIEWTGEPVYWMPQQQWISLTPIEMWQKLGPIRIRTRVHGDRLRTHPRQPRRDLKYLFQQQGIPPWQRHHYPVVVNASNEVLALPNIAVAAELWPSASATMNRASGVFRK